MVPTEALDKKQANDNSGNQLDLAISIQPTAAFVARTDKGKPPGGTSPDIRYFDSSQTKKPWVGKCGMNALVESTYLLEYKEVLSLKLYTLFGVRTPAVTLNWQTIGKEAQDNLFDLLPRPQAPRLYIMSQFLEGFQSLGQQFISNYRKLAKETQYTILSQTGQRIPLRGLGRALAVAGFLHDYDCIGNSGGNMGYVVHPSNTFAEVIKIDGGEALPFQLMLDANKRHDPKQRDIMIGTNIPSLLFKDLTIADQEEFIETIEKILTLPAQDIQAIFSQKTLRDGVSQKTADEWFQLLMARRDLFLSAYAPEVFSILKQRGLKAENQAAKEFYDQPAPNQNQQPLIFSGSAATSNNSFSTSTSVGSGSTQNPNLTTSFFSASSSSSTSSSSSIPSSSSHSALDMPHLNNSSFDRKDFKEAQDFKKGSEQNQQNLALQSQLAASELRAPAQYQLLAAVHQVPQDQKTAIETFQLPPKKLFVGRKEALEFLGKHFSIPQGKLCCIHASGGMGKTQLTAEYVHQAIEAKRYDRVIWLYAEHGQLPNQIALLVELWYNIKAKNLNQNALIQRFYGYLAQSRTCVVIDNALDEASLRAFLPPPDSKVHLLITSRYQNWNAVPKLPLKELTSSEIALYLSQFLGKDFKEADELNKMLGGLPLALVQAASYIKQKDTSIAEYSQLFAKSAALLSEQADANTSTVNTTLTLAIAELRKVDKKLEELFFRFAYLSPDHISIPLFQSLCKLSDSELKKSLDYFQSYSLIYQNGNQLSIHRLTQAVLRLIAQHWKTEQSHYDYVLNWLKPQLNFDDSKMDEIARVEPYMFHASYFLELSELTELSEVDHSIRFKFWNIIGCYSFDKAALYERGKTCFEKARSIAEKHYKGQLELANTLNNLGCAYGKFGDVESQKKSKEFIEGALIIEKEFYGNEELPEIATTKANLANAYGRLGLPYTRINLLQEALRTQRKFYASKPEIAPELAKTLTYLGDALGMINKQEEQIRLLDEALEVERAYYRAENHPEIAKTLTNLGNVAITLAKINKQKLGIEASKSYFELSLAYLERALKIKEQYYGKNHFEFAITLFNLASVWGGLKNAEKQIACLEQCYQIGKSYYENHEFTRKVLGQMIKIKEKQAKKKNESRLYAAAGTTAVCAAGVLTNSALSLLYSTRLLENYSNTPNLQTAAQNGSALVRGFSQSWGLATCAIAVGAIGGGCYIVSQLKKYYTEFSAESNDKTSLKKK